MGKSPDIQLGEVLSIGFVWKDLSSLLITVTHNLSLSLAVSLYCFALTFSSSLLCLSVLPLSCFRVLGLTYLYGIKLGEVPTPLNHYLVYPQHYMKNIYVLFKPYIQTACKVHACLCAAQICFLCPRSVPVLTCSSEHLHCKKKNCGKTIILFKDYAQINNL